MMMGYRRREEESETEIEIGVSTAVVSEGGVGGGEESLEGKRAAGWRGRKLKRREKK